MTNLSELKKLYIAAMSNSGFENRVQRMADLSQLAQTVINDFDFLTPEENQHLPIDIEENLEAICYLASGELPPGRPDRPNPMNRFLRTLYMHIKHKSSTFGDEFSEMRYTLKNRTLVVSVRPCLIGHWIGASGKYIKAMQSEMRKLNIDLRIQPNK